ncbi:hypothetical protein WR25_12381 [Diploscapter pachys]|uniref:Rapamycin-insensitive companion of mTOR N-terminal domain-containing protein n=1 Tax=Diploscapter pachys TaxID=2018661 RepID=A0A2A2J9J5_9BILA|nr:hypothetical protein WR25_12381 [Diploscapter pachys]
MTTARKPPRRPRSLACSKVAGSVDVDDDVDIPPDPKSSNTVRFLPDRPMRCLLLEIDHMKLATQLTSHPSGRSTALLLQALRQQISIASSDDYTKTALEWIAKHDLLMLKMKKNSVFCRVMQADGVESREEMSRLINTMSSFTRGRQYFCAHLKLFLPTVIAILRGRRLPSTTHDQLVACLQKLSVRIVVQREMLNFGMLEWIINLLEQRHSAYAVEYGMGIAINLAQNPFSQPLQLRFADSIAAAAINVLSRDTHGPSCTLINSFVFVALGCSRVKLR